MAGDIVVVEADPWDPSDVTEEMLQLIVDGGLLRPVTDPTRPKWIAPYGEPEPRPRDGYVVSFVSFHERGLGVPADRFMRALPHYYGVELHNFSPNYRRPSSPLFARGTWGSLPTGSCGSICFGRFLPPSR